MKKILAILMFLFLALPSVKAAIIDIAVSDNEFTPPSVSVNVGDQIRWTLVSGFHSTTSMTVPPGAATWDYTFNSVGDEFIYNVTVAGFYDYMCLFHPGMEGDFTASAGPATYVWNQTSTASWIDASNWTPARNTPATNDILIFNNGAIYTVTDVPTQTIGQLSVDIMTHVTLQAGSSGNVLTIDGGQGNDLLLPHSNSSLNISGSNALTIFINSGSTAFIAGHMTISGGAHRINAQDAGSIHFYSVLTQGIGFTGNIFTSAGTPEVALFKSGSVFVYQAGSNPFGPTAPNQKVVFESGSLYRHESTNAPSFSGRTYANFELNFAAASISSTGGNPLTVDNITITDGNINLNLTGTINIKGNILVASGKTLTFTPASAVSHNIIFNGTSAQTIGGLGTLTFGPNANVTINNSNGVTLNKEVTLNRVLALTDGNINTSAVNLLTLGTDVSITGGSSSSYINGPVQKHTNTTSLFIFPTGKNGAYMPCGVTPSTTAAQSCIAEYFASAPSPGSMAGGLTNVSSVEHFTLSGPMTAQVTLSWGANSGVTNPASLRVAFLISGPAWNNGGNDATTGDPSGGTIISNNLPLSSSSEWALGTVSPENPLPVELTDFVATTIKNEVILDWGTGSELNNDGFEVQRVALTGDNPDDLIFETIGFVEGNGTSNDVHYYRFIDRNLPSGTYLYKLKQRDYNNNYTYFLLNAEVVIGIPEKFELMQNFPNPFNPVTKIGFNLPGNGNIDLRVYDINGREVRKLISGEMTGGYHYIDLHAAELSSGIYFYRMTFNNSTNIFTHTKKLMLMK